MSICGLAGCHPSMEVEDGEVVRDWKKFWLSEVTVAA